MATATGKHKDTYRATAGFLVLTGLLYLIDKWVGFGHLGMPWVMEKDTMLLYAAVIFLWFKSDKSVGLILLGIWLIQNIGLVISLLGQMSLSVKPMPWKPNGGSHCLLHALRYSILCVGKQAAA